MNKVSLDILKSHLWESANILRGSIDAADYKNYIFGMLFLKRLSDVFEEEGERIERETGNKKIAWDDPDEHEFFVPEKARWDHIKTHTQNLGEILNKANEALEERNTITLEGVLTVTDFNDKDRLPDVVLSKLIAHFSKIRLRNEDLSEPDILGRAYEYLIGQFADDAGKKGGEFYTPKEVVTLLGRDFRPSGKDAYLRPRMRIRWNVDPVCLPSAGPEAESAKHLSFWSGEKHRHLGDLQNEYAAPWLVKWQARKRGYVESSQTLNGGRKADGVRCRDCQSTLLSQELGLRRSPT